MIEIIYNPKMEPKNQFIDLYTFQFDALYQRNLTFTSQTQVSLAARDGNFFL
jgi:hypothetical protein